MIAAATAVPNILDAISRTNMIDSSGLIEDNHQLVLSLVSGHEISNIVVKTTPTGIAIHIGDLGLVRPSVMPVYTPVTANRDRRAFLGSLIAAD